MKTWEMMQHSGKKFKRKSDGFVIEITPDGTLYWDSGHRFLNINDEWEEVKESIGLVELLEKISREGDITVDFEDYKDEYNFKDTSLDEVLLYLSKEFSGDCLAETLLASKWYIGD